MSDPLHTCPATLADLEKLVSLMNDHSMAFGGMKTTTLAGYKDRLEGWGSNLETNTRLFRTAQGDIAGYCALNSPWPHVDIWSKLYKSSAASSACAARTNS